MKRFPAKVVSLVLALAMSLSLLTVSTVAEENGWWTEEIWDAETLISLGATDEENRKNDHRGIR